MKVDEIYYLFVFCARVQSCVRARISAGVWCGAVRRVCVSDGNLRTRRQSGQFAFVVIVNRLDKCVRFIEIKSNCVHTRDPKNEPATGKGEEEDEETNNGNGKLRLICRWSVVIVELRTNNFILVR